MPENKLKIADAHCHLDIIENIDRIIDESLNEGVSLMITNSTDSKSSLKNLNLSDYIHVFPALGLDPNALMDMNTDKINEEMNSIEHLIRDNKDRVVAIGEIGLDYSKETSNAYKEEQKKVFEHFIELAKELGKPISIHSRDAIDDVLDILIKHKVERAHIHYFEGNEEHARIIAERNFYISIPPIDSSRRRRAIKAIPLSNIMAESDAPAIGEKPSSIIKSIDIISKAKDVSFDEAANATYNNTKYFFNINV
ncbi:MAG: TatD family hydrolase [Candidatus Micrarchaeia archaeon]